MTVTDTDTRPGPLDVLDFWFRAGPAAWFAKSDTFDAEIREKFGTLVDAAASGACDRWEEKPHSALALILLLDQFPRNLFRGSPRAFATDAKAREIADAVIGRGFDKAYPVPQKKFFYLPFEHSEDMADQERFIDLMMASNDEDGLNWGFRHMELIRRFGRFPHRNGVLGRETTEAEAAFLKAGGFSG